MYRDTRGRAIYTLEDGAWAVSGAYVGEPVMRSTSPAPSPDLCQHWEYADRDDDWKYKPGDIKVTFQRKRTFKNKN